MYTAWTVVIVAFSCFGFGWLCSWLTSRQMAKMDAQIKQITGK